MIAAPIDTETTDLVYNRTIKVEKLPHMVEFYGCLYDFEQGKLLQEVDQLIRPPIAMPKESAKITGLSDEMLKSAPTFAEVADSIANFIESAPLIIAHNASFDQEIIDIEFGRLGRKLKWPKLICSVEATIHLKGYRLNLGNLHELLFGERFADAHRAKMDVAALTRCCAELYKRGEL